MRAALVAAFSLLLAVPAFGQYPRDAAANKKTDEALNVHYLGTDFDEAEAVLLGVIEACGAKCRPSTLGRAWMYVGVVRGSGNKDQVGAREAFQQALKTDPAVTLDTALATPETQRTFEALGGQTVAEEEAGEESGEGATAAQGAPNAGSEAPATGGGLECSPGAGRVQTRRPIPVACGGDGEATSMSLRYREYGADQWATVDMTKVGGTFQGQIPCDATRTVGPLHYFVVATDAAGDPVDTFGNKSEPIVIDLAGDVGDMPPSFPGQPAPERCQAEEICPPDFPGCGAEEQEPSRGDKEWGASCEESRECQGGLLCIDGSCETAPSCIVDADCKTGVCHAGKCDIPSGEGESKEAYAKNIVGVHFAVDAGFVGGKDVCRADQNEYDCYLEGSETPYPGPLPADIADHAGEPGDAYPGGGIGNGLTGGTLRVLLSYDRALTSHLTLGARGGFAFRGGPSREGDPSFLPLHLELALGYWMLGLAEQGVRPYVRLSGGVAQVDLKTQVVASDCSSEPSYEAFIHCINAEGDYDSANDPDLPSVTLDAYKKLGQGFVGLGGGALFAVGQSVAAQLNVNLMVMLPDSGLVIEPSLGVTYSF